MIPRTCKFYPEGSRHDLNIYQIITDKSIKDLTPAVFKAAENMDIEALDETFLDVANIVEKRRRVTTVAGLKEELKENLTRYRKMVKDIVVRKEILATGIGVRGKPVTEATLKQYQVEVSGWPKRREKEKEGIQSLVKTIKNFSPHKGKIVIRGNVPLKVFFGGKYPARLEVEYKQGRQRIR